MNRENADFVEKAKKDYGHRIFLFGLEIIAYFGIPAAVGAIIGEQLERIHGKTFTLPILFASYIISWTIFVFRFRAIRKSRKTG